MIRTNATPEKLHFGGIRCPLLLPSCLQEPKKCSRTNPKYSKVPNTNAMTAQMQDGNHYLFPIIRDCKRSFSDLSLSFAVHQCSGGAQTVDAAASASGLLTGPPLGEALGGRARRRARRPRRPRDNGAALGCGGAGAGLLGVGLASPAPGLGFGDISRGILGNIESLRYRECHRECHRIPVPRAHGSVPCLLVGSTRTPSTRTGKTCGKGRRADLLDPNYERGRTRNVWRLFLLILERQEAYL